MSDANLKAIHAYTSRVLLARAAYAAEPISTPSYSCRARCGLHVYRRGGYCDPCKAQRPNLRERNAA